ncbi:MAG: nuclear transport factor 2 family protein [Phycisphaerae bacterium]|nr:nuclear transport factor 2 family protein [Phycisphaerae bacterium]
MERALEVGKKLVELTKQGRWLEAVDTLYSSEIVSIEACAMQPGKQRVEGIAAVREKTVRFLNDVDVHSCVVTGPWPHGDRFIVGFTLDHTPKNGPMAGKRLNVEEAALYTVKDGKIAKEEFFCKMPG